MSKIKRPIFRKFVFKHHSRTFQLGNLKFARVRQFLENSQKFQNPKNLNASIDFEQIKNQRLLIDILYLCIVLGRELEFYESWSYHGHFSKNWKSHRITNRASIVMKIVTIEGLGLLHWCRKFHIDIKYLSDHCRKNIYCNRECDIGKKWWV